MKRETGRVKRERQTDRKTTDSEEGYRQRERE